MHQKNGFTIDRQEACSTSWATDAALVRLVLAGAPTRWLRARPEVSDVEGAPDWQALGHAVWAGGGETAGIGAHAHPAVLLDRCGPG